MPYCNSDGINIYYEIDGSGPEVVMIHGFSSNLEGGWKQAGMAAALKAENRLIMVDCRGHGKSDKPYEPAMYGAKMLDDIINLMGHLNVEKANFLGYSMGSGVSMNFLLTHPERVKSIVLGGYGADPTAAPRVEAGAERRRDRVEALLIDDPEKITDPEVKAYRIRVEARGGDLKALAAVQMGNLEDPAAEISDPETRLERIRAVSVPLMTVLGSDDGPQGDKSKLAMLVANGCHFQISGRDHLSTVPDPRFHMAVRGFLNYVNRQ